MESDHKLVRLGCWSAIGGDLWVEEIFKRLPIKSLGRSRCVCKWWNSLISSAFCVATHHTSSTPPPTNRQPFLLLHSGSCTLYQYPQPLHVSFPFRFQDIATPSNLNYELVDVINGIVCVYYSLSSPFDSTILWNPAIRRYVALPFLPPVESRKKKKKKALEIRVRFNCDLCASHFQPNAIGFGYRNSKNDFKVVRVWIPSSSSSGAVYRRPRYEVFSSQQGLWRECKAKTRVFKGFKSCGFLSPATSCFLNGTIHWLLPTSKEAVPTEETYSLMVLMFDCEREEFRAMELPEQVSHFQAAILGNGKGRGPVMTRLSKYSGMLSVLLCPMEKGRFELWVMNEQTWNRLFTIVDGDFDFNSHLVMLREDGRTCKHLLSYDPNISSYVYEGLYQPLNGYVYEESMFLIDINNTNGAKYYAKDDEAIDIQLHPKTSSGNRWRCPPVNWIKLNTHGAVGDDMHPEGFGGGVGGVFRDDQGRFVKAFASKIIGVESAFEAQLVALWHGLQEAMCMGIRSLIVETDSIQVVQAVTTSNYVTPTYGYLRFWPCELLIRGPAWGGQHGGPWHWRVGVCHVPPELNKAAHWFAKTGMTQKVVFNDVPYEVEQLM